MPPNSERDCVCTVSESFTAFCACRSSRWSLRLNCSSWLQTTTASLRTATSESGSQAWRNSARQRGQQLLSVSLCWVYWYVCCRISVHCIGRMAVNNNAVLSHPWLDLKVTLFSSRHLIPAATICPVRSSLCRSRPATRWEPRRTEESWSAGASKWRRSLRKRQTVIISHITGVTSSIMIIFFYSSVSLSCNINCFTLLFQPTADGGRIQRRLRFSFQVLRPLALQTVPGRGGGQRRRPQRHLCQLQRFRPGRRERQLPVWFSGGTRKKGADRMKVTC